MATIVFAGGGTAGHIQPALSVAREWMRSHPNDECIFLGTVSGLETTLVPAAKFQLALIPKVSISRKPSVTWLQIPLDLLRSVNATRLILKNADLLIGFGGYVSGPAYLAAKLTRLPFLIHEANAKPGWANRLGSAFTKFLAVSNPVSKGRFSQGLLTGLPLQEEISQAFEQSKLDWKSARVNAKKSLGFPTDHPLIAIVGGSQGSVAINSVVAESIADFESMNYSVLHSVGAKNTVPESIGNYRAVPYIQDMAQVYLAADLLVARSGAVTCSEFRALGRYAVFVPLPIGNGEQYLNAVSLQDENRAVVINQSDFNVAFLRQNLPKLLAASSQSMIQGNDQDLQAAKKIVALAEFAMKS